MNNEGLTVEKLRKFREAMKSRPSMTLTLDEIMRVPAWFGVWVHMTEWQLRTVKRLRRTITHYQGIAIDELLLGEDA